MIINRMAKNIKSQPAVPKARLTISKAKFSQYLNERIVEGRILLKKSVSSEKHPQDCYYSYSARNVMSPVRFTDEQETFMSEFQKWTDYNSELLKQSFDIGDNEYQAKYVRSGQSLVISANEEIATALVTMLRTLGFNKNNLFCSSVPGYNIAEGEDFYETLA